MQLQPSSAAAVTELRLTTPASHVITAITSLDINLQHEVLRVQYVELLFELNVVNTDVFSDTDKLLYSPTFSGGASAAKESGHFEVKTSLSEVNRM